MKKLSKKKLAIKNAIDRFTTEAINFERTQEWKKAAIRWEHCARISEKNEKKAFFSYSAFFCYKRSEDIPKAYAMIQQTRNKYLLLNDTKTAKMCAVEMEILNAPATQHF